MRIMLGGKFESALIRGFDEFNNPERNRTTHPYYMGLNRKSDPFYLERLGTFLAIADETIVAGADWDDRGSVLTPTTMGVRLDFGLNEWDDPNREFAKQLLEQGAFSDASIAYIADLDLGYLAPEQRAELQPDMRRLRERVSEHYLCRLFLQLREASERRIHLVLDERDITLISEIRDYVIRTGSGPEFDFPDLQDQVVLGSQFAGGMFNFAPHDMQSIAAIKADPIIERYATQVRRYIGEASTLESERGLLDAMRKSHRAVERDRKVENVFETISWIAKPLHYVPGVDAVLSVAEDIKDVAGLLVDRDEKDKEWYLLAARATQINIEEYLKRKANL